MRSLSRLLKTSALVASVAAMAVSGAVAPGHAASAAQVEFAPHQALYGLSLLRSRGNVSINNASGRILYNFSGSACEGYSTDFRQVSELDAGEGKTVFSDFRSTNWEAADGGSYRFRIENRSNDSDPVITDGVAERTGEGITVRLKRPAEKTFKIDGDTIFPTEQVKRVIEAAREGKSVLELKVYDGSDNGEKVFNTFTVIGQPITGDKGKQADDVAASSSELKSRVRWPVTVSYYDSASKPETGEQTPAFAMSFELYDNGVSRALVIDYNDFVISGAMTRFEAKPAKPCNK